MRHPTPSIGCCATERDTYQSDTIFILHYSLVHFNQKIILFLVFTCFNYLFVSSSSSLYLLRILICQLFSLLRSFILFTFKSLCSTSWLLRNFQVFWRIINTHCMTVNKGTAHTHIRIIKQAIKLAYKMTSKA